MSNTPSNSFRCFLGFSLPNDICLAFLRHCKDIAQDHPELDKVARWQKRDQLHLTLVFLGQLKVTQLKELDQSIKQALDQVDRSAIATNIECIDYFPGNMKPVCIAAKLNSPESLVAFHHVVNQACAPFMKQTEKRAYKPHITLARIKCRLRSPPSIRVLTDLPFLIEKLYLYKSTPTPGGSRYDILESWSLTGKQTPK